MRPRYSGEPMILVVLSRNYRHVDNRGRADSPLQNVLPQTVRDDKQSLEPSRDGISEQLQSAWSSRPANRRRGPLVAVNASLSEIQKADVRVKLGDGDEWPLRPTIPICIPSVTGSSTMEPAI